MENYFKRKSIYSSQSSGEKDIVEPSAQDKIDDREESNIGGKRDAQEKIDLTQLPSDPGLRTPIGNYNINVQDEIRRIYVQRGPCQPRNHMYPQKEFGDSSLRRFKPSWFNDFPSWLEYSIAKDALFCFYCYLFKSNTEGHGGGDSFVEGGFSNWKKKERIQTHVGKIGSAHNESRITYQAFVNQKQNIDCVLFKKSKSTKDEYRIRLNASIDCVRFLLRQGLSFRGNDESEDSKNQGNFLELLKWLCDQNNEINAVSLKNAPENLQLTSPCIQKDIVSAIAFETLDVIMKDIGDGLFSILVDESRDISMKEQMSIVLRYVNKKGQVMERFIGVEHVSSTTALSLKDAIDQLFSRFKLSISSLRGQGYDGASNMRGEYNGLKALILKENPSAFYIHCFAHQLQLALVAVANKHADIETFFTSMNKVVNVVGGSAKRCDLLREKKRLEVVESLNLGEISSGTGLNQETTLKRPGDTRWGSHYSSLLSLIVMFSATVDVVEIIATDDTSCGKRGEARHLLRDMLSFDFIFSLHLMKKVLGISDELSKSLQRRDQDIVNAMKLVKICKERLQTTRDNEWDSFLRTVSCFCERYNIDVPNMDDLFIPLGRSRRNINGMTNLHHFRVDFFYAIIDLQIQELNDRFSEANSDLLLRVACLCPNNSFFAFDKDKLIQLCEYYPNDFTPVEIMTLEEQIQTYIIDMRTHEDFEGLRGLNDLAEKLVVTKKNEVYPLVYRLITLALILPVATATVERVFSAMKIVKNRLRNRMGDIWLSNSMIIYIESDVFNNINNDVIIRRFQSMKTRRLQL